MRLYKGISRLRYHRLFNKYNIALLKWAVALKPGDLISGCTTWPFNTIVKSIEIDRNQPWQGKGSFVSEVVVQTTDGYQHTCPGGGCVSRPLTPEQVREVLQCRHLTEQAYIEGLDRAITEGWRTAGWKVPQLDLYHRAHDGRPVCDEMGQRLPDDLKAYIEENDRWYAAQRAKNS